MSHKKHVLAVALATIAVTLTACNNPALQPPPVAPSSTLPPAAPPPTDLMSLMPTGTSNCDSAATAPSWFDGNQPDTLLACYISPDGDSDNITGYQWDAGASDPGQFLSEMAGGANGDGPTSVTSADSIASCPPLAVAEGCQFSWSGPNGSGAGLYFQAGYGNEDLTWTYPAQGAVFEIFDYSGANDIAGAELQLATWFIDNIQGM